MAMFHRRTLLGAAALVGATAVIPTGAAHAVHNVTVTSFPVGDAAPVIQDAIDEVAINGGGTVHLPAGTATVSTTLHLKSGVTLQGQGALETQIRETATLGRHPIMVIGGTESVRLSAVGVQDLAIRNGTATTGPFLSGQDGVVVEWVDGLTIQGCRLEEIAGRYALRLFSATDVAVTGTEFHRCAHSMMMVLADCEDITVSSCVFDTVLSQHYAYSYTFGTGYDGTLDYVATQGPRNIVVEDSLFLNNPRWEGIDCHGAAGIVIRNNHVENCRVGILVGNHFQDSCDVEVSGNTLIQGVADTPEMGRGIIVESTDVAIERVKITNNVLTGFAGGNAQHGVITVYGLRDLEISGNELHDVGAHGICLMQHLEDVVVEGNLIHNLRLAPPTGDSGAINGHGSAIYGVRCQSNVVAADTPAQQFDHLVRSPQNYQSWQFGFNDPGNGISGTLYEGVDHLPVDKTSLPTERTILHHGDHILDPFGNPAWVVTAPTGYGSTDSTTVMVTGVTTLGSTALSVDNPSGGRRGGLALPRGMHVDGDSALPPGVWVTETSLPPNTGVVVQVSSPALATGAVSLKHAPLTFTAVTLSTLGLRAVLAHLATWDLGDTSLRADLESACDDFDSATTSNARSTIVATLADLWSGLDPLEIGPAVDAAWSDRLAGIKAQI